jgi:hypothetical protein
VNERVVTFGIDTEADSTAFNIEYSTDLGTWVTFDPVNGTPVPPADIAVGLLDAGTYTIDGINTPAGNEAAASRHGNFYRARLKNLGGYGNWSQPFEIGGVYTSPTVADILTHTGITTEIENLSSTALEAKLQSLIATAELKTKLAVGRANFNSDELETDQISALQMAAVFRVGAAYYRQVAAQRSAGTEEPIAMEEAESLRRQADLWDSDEGQSGEESPAVFGEAQAFDRLFLADIGEDSPVEEAAAELEFGTIVDVNGEYLDSHFPQWLNDTEFVIH